MQDMTRNKSGKKGPVTNKNGNKKNPNKTILFGFMN